MEEEQEIEIPCYFLCPISMQLMKDPVTVSTGITYDRDSIEKWLLLSKNPTCPVTNQDLSNKDLTTPNHTLRRIIQEWSAFNAYERIPTPKAAPLEKSHILHQIQSLQYAFHVADPEHLIGSKPEIYKQIVHILRDNISHQATKTALKLLVELCQWGRNRIKAVENGAVPVLIELLLETEERRICELVLTVLDQVCGCAEGRAELVGHGAGLAVVSKKILRVSNVASERGVRILCSICRHSWNSRVVNEMMQVGVVSKLCLVLQVESSHKTKERAKEILRLHSRVWKDSLCIPPHLLSSYPIS